MGDGGVQLEIRITGRHVEVPDDVRDYLQEKANKLPRFYDRIHAFDVVLDHQSDQFMVEMIVHADRKQTFVVSDAGPDTFALVDSLIDKLERQLVRHKEKMRQHKHEGRPDLTPDEPDEPDES